MEQQLRPGGAIPLSAPEREARVQLAACYRIFDYLRWTEMIFNHISLRVPGEEGVFLINPFGLRYREVTASSLVAIDLEGSPVRPAEHPVNRAGFMIHSAIHGAIPEARCVMHTHTTTGMAVACLKQGLSHDSFYGAQLAGRVAYHDFEGVTVEPGEKERLVRSIGDKRAVILRNHGLLAWGASLPEAFMMLWTLQRACDVQIAASATGEMNPVSAEAIERASREAGPAEPRVCEMVFDSLVRVIEGIDPGYRN
jgi:ribulose-5-phosphate 4-epimerase/fuculose-1-phosphate aldolase